MKKAVKDPAQQFFLSELKKTCSSPEFEEMILKQQLFHSQIHEVVNNPELSEKEKWALGRLFEKQNFEFSKLIRFWHQSRSKPGKDAAFTAVMALPSMNDLIERIKSNRSHSIAA